MRRALKQSRLVTLVGPGGVGKTRLAIELARSVGEAWPDGVFLSDLSALDGASEVADAVVASLQLPEGGAAQRAVNAWLRDRRVLLLLDNCEHLAESCADFCRACLSKCPVVGILATSREPLGVAGEMRYPLMSLGEDDAMRLFEERARLVAPRFETTPANREVVKQICRKLDAIPLAIELAASRLGMLTEQEIAVQLDREPELLAGGRSGATRHRTMKATIDWSYRLLTEAEALLFRRLAVFRGGFTLEAVSAVCADDRLPNVFEVLSGLVEKSMVVAEKLDDGATRYRFLELQGAFAPDRLGESDELEKFRSRHYEFFVNSLVSHIGDEFHPRTVTLDEVIAIHNWKRRELANVWVALDWAKVNLDDLGLDAAWMFNRFGPTLDTVKLLRWMEGLLDHFPNARLMPSRLRPGEDTLFRAHAEAARNCFLSGIYEGALAHAAFNVELAHLQDDDAWRQRRVAALNQRALALRCLGRFDEARPELDEAMQLAFGTGNPNLVDAALRNMADLAFAEGRFDEARRIQTNRFASSEPIGPGTKAWRMVATAALDLECGDLDEVQPKLAEAFSIARVHKGPYLLLDILAVFMRLVSLRGQHQLAIRLAAAHERGNEAVGGQDEPYSRELMRRCIELSRASLGPKKSDEAWKQGWAMEVDQAIAHALEEQRISDTVSTAPLSRREVSVARLIATGVTNREIADKLFLSERTVEGHLDRIRNKLNIRSRAELATWAAEHGLHDS